MTAAEIKAAVEAGHTVNWANEMYKVIKDRIGQWLLAWNHGEPNPNYTGLTWKDGVTLNGDEELFYILLPDGSRASSFNP